MAAILQRVQRRAVRDDEGRAGLEVHLRRQGQHAVGGHQALLRESAPPGRSEHAVALPGAGDAASYFLDYPGHLHPRRKGERRLHLVETLHEERVREVEGAGLNFNHHLVWARMQGGDLLHREPTDGAILAAEQRFHPSLPLSWFPKMVLSGFFKKMDP